MSSRSAVKRIFSISAFLTRPCVRRFTNCPGRKKKNILFLIIKKLFRTTELARIREQIEQNLDTKQCCHPTTPARYISWVTCTISVSLLSFYLGSHLLPAKGPGKVTLSRTIVCFIILFLCPYFHFLIQGSVKKKRKKK